MSEKSEARRPVYARSDDQDGMPIRFIDALSEALLRASRYNPQDQIAPAAVLWTDRESQWEKLIPLLRDRLSQLITLGPYSPELRTGPAIWIRCVLDRMLPLIDWPVAIPPIIYLPGVSRHELRAVEDCPQYLQPLAELQYRGVWFTQESTKDWTPPAFLTSDRGGLGLDVSPDSDTRDAIAQVLPKLAEVRLSELQNRRLDAAAFRALLQPDLIKELLRWLDSPDQTRSEWSDDGWRAFCSGCIARFGFDPAKDGQLIGAERLGARESPWDEVWYRYCESPQTYPKIPDLLRRVRPVTEDLFFHPECWPHFNECAEEELRAALASLVDQPRTTAATEIEKLEQAHSARRGWVWAKLGQAPLAATVEHLAILARRSVTNASGQNPVSMAVAYSAEGWRVDAAVLDALACVSRAVDVQAVRAAIRAIYMPWLEGAALLLQQHVTEGMMDGTPGPHVALGEVDRSVCIVFADGLRMDIGKRVAGQLARDGLQVQETWRWAPMPSVTGTTKAAASPVAELLTGQGGDPEQFQPAVRATGQPLTAERFRRLLESRGFQCLGQDETGDPEGHGWTEHGAIDRRGHDDGWELARRLGEEVASLAERVVTLLDAGWNEIHIITDHGWLLLPGGLPKSDLPSYLVNTRWARCSVLRTGVRAEGLIVPWHWNPEVQLVLAPGITCFREGMEYAHGSLSLQECVVPHLVVTSTQASRANVTLEPARWTGLRCRVHVSGAGPSWHVDLRTRAAEPTSSIAKEGRPVPLGQDGRASLVVDDPDKEGVAVIVVVLDGDGHVVAKQNTTVAGEQ